MNKCNVDIFLMSCCFYFVIIIVTSTTITITLTITITITITIIIIVIVIVISKQLNDTDSSLVRLLREVVKYAKSFSHFTMKMMRR